jgi:hypothetical protein
VGDDLTHQLITHHCRERWVMTEFTSWLCMDVLMLRGEAHRIHASCFAAGFCWAGIWNAQVDGRSGWFNSCRYNRAWLSGSGSCQIISMLILSTCCWHCWGIKYWCVIIMDSLLGNFGLHRRHCGDCFSILLKSPTFCAGTGGAYRLCQDAGAWCPCGCHCDSYQSEY